jgi:hypothetical protein
VQPKREHNICSQSQTTKEKEKSPKVENLLPLEIRQVRQRPIRRRITQNELRATFISLYYTSNPYQPCLTPEMRTAHRRWAANQNDLRSTIRRVIRRARAVVLTNNTNTSSSIGDTIVITSDSTLLVTSTTPAAQHQKLPRSSLSSAVAIPIPPIRSSSSSNTESPPVPILIDELSATQNSLLASLRLATLPRAHLNPG